MILAQVDDGAVVIGGKAELHSGGSARSHFQVQGPLQQPGPAALAAVPREPAPLTEQEIEEYSSIKCYVCGQYVKPENVTEHSQGCVLDPAPNFRLQLDKWCIASSTMTSTDLRTFLHMRRTEELARVELLELDLAKRLTQLWWMSGRFGYVVSSRWLREWRSFVGVGRPSTLTRDRPPSPINNSDLFDLDGSVRTSLVEGIQHDFQKMEAPMWHFFQHVYGGGPAVLRYSPADVQPSLTDELAVFEGEWRDLRPDSGFGRVFDPQSGCGFDGEIKEGFLWSCTGKGLLRSGSHFEGRVSAGLPDGEGREVHPDGMLLEGNFREGKLHGLARLTTPDGVVEEGEWEHGVLSGI